jgi:flagellum-specific peptidoglycan hydrolase FlgJ
MGINIDTRPKDNTEVCIDSFKIDIPVVSNFISNTTDNVKVEIKETIDKEEVATASFYTKELYKDIKDTLALKSLDKEKADFILNNSSSWIEENVLYGVSAAVSAAQAILESGFGQSKLAKEHNAYYGVKFVKNSNLLYLANGESVKYYDNYEKQKDGYVSFDSHWYSIRHHTRLMLQNYRGLLYKDWKYSVQYLEDRGYATTANYCKRSGCKNGHYNKKWKKEKKSTCYFGKESRSETCKIKGCIPSYSKKLDIGSRIYAEKLTSIIKKYKLYNLDKIAESYFKKVI